MGIKQLAIGHYFALALDEFGFVFVWGDGSYGETSSFTNAFLGLVFFFTFEVGLPWSGVSYAYVQVLQTYTAIRAPSASMFMFDIMIP